MKKLFLATAMLFAVPMLAHADNILVFGGQKLCSEIIHTVTIKDREGVLMWSGWMLGYWSGLNQRATNAADGWVGESFVSTGEFGTPIIKMIWAECEKNPRESLATATETIYRDLQSQGK